MFRYSYMSKAITLITLFLGITVCTAFVIPQPESTIKFGLLKYAGGGDWYANPTALPNLIEFCNINLNMNVDPDPSTLEVGSPEIFTVPYLHMTGHGNVVFSDDEAINLRSYLIAGGFLHIDDNYGMDKFVRPAMKKVFPELEFTELPFSHPIYHQQYDFTTGPPKIHEHDNKAPQGLGLVYEGKLVCFYTFETDLGDGWEDQDVHNDTEDVRQKALRMGANIIQYVFTRKS